ncbi:MAG TPA: DUF1015 domain-containing protein [Firmicutes bacterium]|nr:DUF1015 domain-containing protein [Bacillota bacterium]
MACIVPIAGIRYSDLKVKNLAEVIAPPYDVISAEEQHDLYRNNPYNIIRLEKPRDEGGEGDGPEKSNKYWRAAAQYQSWLEEGVLLREKEEAIYLYEQHFSYEGKTYIREGFTCGVKAEPYSTGTVLPHEETLQKPIEDRLKLMRSCKANFSPIFGLYEDSKNLAMQILRAAAGANPPVISFTDKQGHIHKAWKITGRGAIEELAALFKAKKLFIADGHHRYETAVKYREENGPKPGKHDYVMMTLFNIYDPGLLVLPTHRLVINNCPETAATLLQKLRGTFAIETLSMDGRTICAKGLEMLGAAGKDRPALGLYAGGEKYYLLKYRGDLEETLDTIILQEEILAKYLGIDAEKCRQGDCLDYTRDCREAVTAVAAGRCKLAFLLNPPPAGSVIAVAEAGKKMPQKSTYFYPKLASGLIINPLD